MVLNELLQFDSVSKFSFKSGNTQFKGTDFGTKHTGKTMKFESLCTPVK